MPQLNGLRAFAVSAVLIHHYIPTGWQFGANFGVKLFFVLSGFLITSILIRARNRCEENETPMLSALRAFYIRRFLRIFPLFYIVIITAAFLNAEGVREYLVYLLTYTINLKMGSQGWFIDHLAHFWTLAIEEQYYLVWPWIVLLISRASLIPAIFAITLLGPAYRLYLIIGWIFFDFQTPGLASYIFTLSAFDTLGIGSLLALVLHSDIARARVSSILSKVILPVGIVILAALTLFKGSDSHWWLSLLFTDVGVAFVCCWLVFRGTGGFTGIVGRLLSLRVIRYIGKVSYGVYVYHPLVPGTFTFLAGTINFSFSQFTITGFFLCTFGTLLLSSLSWHFVEKPINDLKRHFEN
jgi:peptidoglycan/LPS O-acetylase OafA/YrhL